MYTRILLPTDGSIGTAHIVMEAFDLLDQEQGTVHILHVVDTNMPALLVDGTELKEKLRQRGEQILKHIRRMADVHGIETVTELREGDPAAEILAYADETEPVAIVMGTHGRSGIKRRLIGGVAEQVVRQSEYPVLTIRLSETDRTVTSADQAGEIASEALKDSGHTTVTIDTTNQQQNVWVVEATTEDTSYIIYVDPVTQRASPIARDRSLNDE